VVDRKQQVSGSERANIGDSCSHLSHLTATMVALPDTPSAAKPAFLPLIAPTTSRAVTGHRAIITSVQLTDEQRDAIIDWAERTPQVQAVMLFGSRCKGTARPDSDVDLALSMTSGRWQRRFENYRDNVNAWERVLTDAVGLTVMSAHATRPWGLRCQPP
jgi:predicted nucleotidyltransferase